MCSLGRRFFKAKPFRMTLHCEAVTLGRRFFLLAVVRMTYTWQKILHFTSSRSEWHALGKGLFIFTTLALHWNGNVCHICFNGRFRRVVLIHCSGHAPHAFGRHERVEMYARYASVFQFPGLRCTPFHAYFTGSSIVAAGRQFPG